MVWEAAPPPLSSQAKVCPPPPLPCQGGMFAFALCANDNNDNNRKNNGTPWDNDNMHRHNGKRGKVDNSLVRMGGICLDFHIHSNSTSLLLCVDAQSCLSALCARTHTHIHSHIYMYMLVRKPVSYLLFIINILQRGPEAPLRNTCNFCPISGTSHE